MKVVSFNIRSMDDPNGNSIIERAPRLAKVIGDIDPDLIGIQEFVPKWEKPFEEFFSEKYDMLNKYRTREGWIESGPLLWRRGAFELREKGWFWFSDTPDVESGGWDTLGHKRMCCWVRLKRVSDKKEFVFMNTHFGFGDEGQVNSARLIRDRIKDFGDLPVFITGDFNSLPSSLAYREMTSFLKDANAADLVSATFHGYNPASPGQHIDYCFINDRVSAESVRIITERPDGKFPSDHYGLELDLDI